MADTGNALLDRMPAADRDLILGGATRVPLILGDDLVAPGDRILHVHFPLSGIISTVNEMADGRSVEAFMVGREGVAGIEATVIPMTSASRQTIQVTGEALKVETARMRLLVDEHPSIRRTLALHHAGVQRELEQTSACHALHPSHRRLAKWLLRCHDRSDGDVMQLTQEYMAAMLGSQRSTVNEAARLLQAEGAVSYSRGQVRVLDRKALERASCECYRKIVVHQNAAA